MILFSVDYSGIWVDLAGESPHHFSTVSEAIGFLKSSKHKSPIVMVYPVGGMIPDDSLVRLTGHLVDGLSGSKSMMPELNQFGFELSRRLLEFIDTKEIWIGFDDHLYHSIPREQLYYALPYDLAVKNFRHGNDGLAHEWAGKMIGKLGLTGAQVTIHLQERPTLCAFRDGEIMDMSTGYSPVDGIAGLTTSGSIDPSLAIMIAGDEHSTTRATQILASESGWKTVENPQPMQVQSILKSIGAMAAAASGLDGLFFFGDPREDHLQLARQICAHLSPFGLVSLPHNPNWRPGGNVLTTPESRVTGYWYPTTIQEIFGEMLLSRQ